MREPASTAPQEAAVVDDDRMAFVAFVLRHAACGDGVLEIRAGERCLLEWCSACGVMRAFVSRADSRSEASLIQNPGGPVVSRTPIRTSRTDYFVRPGVQRGREAMDRATDTRAHDAEREDRPDHPPRVSDALKAGVAVSVTTWSGKTLGGTISDRDQAGLLLDIGGTDGEDGYAFLPWSSVEQVDIPEVAHRRVKVLQG